MKGIALKIGSQIIQLPELAVSMQKYAPFFDIEKSRASFAFPFTVDYSPQIRQVFSGLELLQAKNGFRYIDGVTMLSDGYDVFSGRLYIMSAELNLNHWQGTIEMSLVNEGNIFWNDFSDRNIRTLECGGKWAVQGGVPDAINLDEGSLNRISIDFTKPYELTDRPVSSWCAQNVLGASPVTYGTDWFCFPSIYVDNADESIYKNTVNYWYYVAPGDGYFAVCKIDEVETTKAVALPARIVPCYYYHKVFNEIFTELGYTLSCDLNSTDHFKRMSIFNTYNILQQIIIELSTEDYTYNFYGEESTIIDPANHLPDMSIKEFMHDFMIKFNAFFVFDGSSCTVKFSKFKTAATKELTALDPNIRTEYAGQTETGVSLRYELPDDAVFKNARTLNEQLSSLKEYFNYTDLTTADPDDELAITYQDNIIRENKSPDWPQRCANIIGYYTGSGNELVSKLPPPEAIQKVYGDNIGLCWLPKIGSSIGRWTTNVMSYTLDYVSVSGPDEHTAYYDLTGQTGFSYRAGSNEWFIAFYYGLIDPNSIGEYPLANNSNYIYPDVTRMGDFHLGWHGKYGLVSVFYGKFIRFFDSPRKQIFKIYGTEDQFKQFDWTEPYIIRNREYYIAILRAEFPLYGPIIADAYEL